MCNLYSITTNQAAIIALFRVINRYVGNLPPMPGVFPDYPAPVVRNTDAGRALTKMRWGMPPPLTNGGVPVTNIRNTSSPHWRGWLKPENRCLVPANSFAEYAPEANPETKKKDVVRGADKERASGVWPWQRSSNPSARTSFSIEQVAAVLDKLRASGDYDRIIAEAGSQQLSVSGADTRAASAAPSRGRRRRRWPSRGCSFP
jgi:putative SOS response-associated peptidase YedK